MAKYTFVIEDLPNGDVSITSDPPFEHVAALFMAKESMTPADEYATSVHVSLQKATDGKWFDHIQTPGRKLN